MLDFFTIQTSSAHPTLLTGIYSVLLSFLLSTLIGITYEKTFRGLSYSRNFVQSLILSSVVSSTIMLAIGDSLARGLGMIGALAIIRFRTNFRDPRDIIFMFAALASGIASGVSAYSSGVVGSVIFCALCFVLHFTPFGTSSYFDGMLRFNAEHDAEGKRLVDEILTRYCRSFALITLRDMSQGSRLDYAYHVKLRKGAEKAELVEKLQAVPAVKGVSLLLQETTVEL